MLCGILSPDWSGKSGQEFLEAVRLWETVIQEWEIQSESDEDAAYDPEIDEREPIKLRHVRLRVWFEGFEGDEEGEITLHTYLPYGGGADE